MRTWAKRQAAFMTAGGQTTDRYNEDQLVRYMEHIDEEVKETKTDFADCDDVRTLDGLCDTIVVCMGAILSMGIDPDNAMEAVLNANERKIVDGKVFTRGDGQIGKPPGWFGPEEELNELLNMRATES